MNDPDDDYANTSYLKYHRIYQESKHPSYATNLRDIVIYIRNKPK